MPSHMNLPSSLPYHLDYDQPHTAIEPESFTINTSSTPLNGSSFSAGNIIQVTLPRQDCLVPDSVYIRYTQTLITGTANGFMAGCPVYSPFLKLETLIGGQSEETLMNHNLVQNFVMNVNYTTAQKYALENAYGYTALNATNKCNGHLTTVGVVGNPDVFSVSAPLNNCLTNCKQYLPLALMGQVQLNFTLDAMANIMGFVNTSTNTSYTISNFEVCYELYHPSNAFMDNLRARGGISLKTLTFPTSSIPLASGSVGTQILSYNIGSFKSIKSAFLLGCPTASGVNLIRMIAHKETEIFSFKLIIYLTHK